MCWRYKLQFVGEGRSVFAVKGFASLSQKRPPIQRAERWSPPQRRNLLFGVFFFAKLFSLRLWSQRKKRVSDSKNTCVERGTPHLCGSPLPSYSSAFTPLWRLGRIGEFRALRGATADRGGSDELLKKLEQNFQTDKVYLRDKSKFESIYIYPSYPCG
jgi:hypothetical protein